MYTKGQRVVVREEDTNNEVQALVEDIVVSGESQGVRVKLQDGSRRVVDSRLVVEHLED